MTQYNNTPTEHLTLNVQQMETYVLSCHQRSVLSSLRTKLPEHNTFCYSKLKLKCIIVNTTSH